MVTTFGPHFLHAYTPSRRTMVGHETRLHSLQEVDADDSSGMFLSRTRSYDILWCRVPPLELEITVQLFAEFFDAYMQARDKCRKVLFVYDVTKTRYEHVTMSSIRAFADCHRQHCEDYPSFLLGTYMIAGSRSSTVVRIMQQILSMLYHPVRPLHVTDNDNDLYPFAKKCLEVFANSSPSNGDEPSSAITYSATLPTVDENE